MCIDSPADRATKRFSRQSSAVLQEPETYQDCQVKAKVTRGNPDPGLSRFRALQNIYGQTSAEQKHHNAKATTNVKVTENSLDEELEDDHRSVTPRDESEDAEEEATVAMARDDALLDTTAAAAARPPSEVVLVEGADVDAIDEIIDARIEDGRCFG